MNVFHKIVAGVKRMAGFTVDPLHPRDPGLAKLFGLSQPVHSGVEVTHDTVLGLPAVIRATNIISNGVAKVPFYVFKLDGESQTWDTSHPSWDCVSRKPNTDFTVDVFRQTMTAWAVLYGNAVAYIDRPNWPNSTKIELLPLLPDRTRPMRLSREMVKRYDVEDQIGTLYYTTIVNGKEKIYRASECLHIRGFGPNPYWGYDIVEVLRQTFGGAIASQEFGHRFFGQGANPAGFVTMPAGLDEEAEERFVESLRRASEGMGKSHRLAILEEGSDFKPWTIDPEKAQFLQGKEFDVRLLAMALGIKVHKLIDSANSSFKSLEQANQEHKEDDLLPWINRWRWQMSDKLLTGEQAKSRTHSIDVDDEYLEWAPFAERAEGVVKLYHGGLVDKEEGRRRVNFGPSRSQYGRRYLKPLNLAWEDEQLTSARPAPPPPPTDDEGAAAASLLTSAWLSKIATRLSLTAKELAAKDGKRLCEWIDTLSADEGPAVIQPAIDSLHAEFIALVNDVLNTSSENELRVKLGGRLDAWLESQSKPELVA